MSRLLFELTVRALAWTGTKEDVLSVTVLDVFFSSILDVVGSWGFCDWRGGIRDDMCDVLLG